MRSLIEAAGVDYDQWLALTRALLKRDFRTRSSQMARGNNGPATGNKALIAQAIFYSVFGVFLSFAIIVSQDLFFVGVVMSAYVMFMVGTAVLLDHSSALTAADDYAVLGFRPVTSRTYFAVRLTNVLVYTLMMTTMVVYIPIGALFWKHGVVAGVAGFFALYGSSIGIAFALLLGYASLQRVVGAKLLKQVLSYVQLAMSFFVYGGYFFVSKMVSKSFLTSFALPKTWWLLALPPSWFASYLELATGRVTLELLVPAAMSVVVLVAMSVALTGKLSEGFTDRLGESTVAPRAAASRPAKSSKAGWWFTGGEGRAMALLIRSQFRNDQKFRMGVLTIIPLTVLYIFQGVSRDGDGSGRPGSEFALVGFAIMMFPAMLKMQLTRSDAYKASWIFFAAPVNRARLIRAAKDVVVAMFLLPYLVFVMVAMSWATKSPAHAVVHVGLLGLISHLVLQVTILMDPELPFAKPMEKGRGPASLFALFIGIGIVNVALTVFAPQLYGSWLATAGAAIIAIVASVFVELLTKARVEEQARKLEFVG
jgi:hypothetical protein